MTEAEMAWQLDFLGGHAAGASAAKVHVWGAG